MHIKQAITAVRNDLISLAESLELLNLSDEADELHAMALRLSALRGEILRSDNIDAKQPTP